MQRGTIIKHHGSWALRYYDVELRDGLRVRKKAFKRLALVGPDYPTKRSVEPLAWKILDPINTKRLQPESAMPVMVFIEDVYLPYVKLTLRPSTHLDYRNAFKTHLKSRLGDVRLRDFRTVTGQRIIAGIARDNPSTGHKTLLRIKSFLSGALKHAKREGLIDNENPMRDVSVPGRAKKFKGEVYSLQEIYDMLQHLSGVAAVTVATVAFTGLRLAELRGLQWRDFDGTSLKISRTVWRTRVGETKNPESEGSVPVLPVLQRILTEHRKVSAKAGKDNDWLFRGERRGASLNLDNLVRRVIVPMLTRCSICRQMQEGHGEEHEFTLDTSIPNWRGWHSFRRSLASNLYGMGVAPKIIQAILRHSDIGTTLAYYVETPDSESREALNKIDAWVKIMVEQAEDSVPTGHAREFESLD